MAADHQYQEIVRRQSTIRVITASATGAAIPFGIPALAVATGVAAPAYAQLSVASLACGIVLLGLAQRWAFIARGNAKRELERLLARYPGFDATEQLLDETQDT